MMTREQRKDNLCGGGSGKQTVGGGREKEDKWSQQMLIWYMDSPALLATLQMEHDTV